MLCSGADCNAGPCKCWDPSFLEYFWWVCCLRHPKGLFLFLLLLRSRLLFSYLCFLFASDFPFQLTSDCCALLNVLSYRRLCLACGSWLFSISPRQEVNCSIRFPAIGCSLLGPKCCRGP
ncbi:hypothetical protein BDZ91DRAFT_726119 [Kalaharituber pfeilii]|nr:hypothetical protein BDZ91DRAFT_726119 [Kalaharituber pfeilii]